MLAAAACDLGSSKPEPATLARIERSIELRFPARSMLLRFSEPPRFIDPTWVAKVSIPSSSLPAFQSLVAKKPDEPLSVSGGLTESTDWWKPGERVLTKQFMTSKQILVRLVLAREAESPMAYIEYIVF